MFLQLIERIKRVSVDATAAALAVESTKMATPLEYCEVCGRRSRFCMPYRQKLACGKCIKKRAKIISKEVLDRDKEYQRALKKQNVRWSPNTGKRVQLLDSEVLNND